MKFISDLAANKKAWQLLAMSALAFELVALFFQYGMDLQPCVMCIYQRVAVWALFIAGVIGSVGCKNIIARILAFGLWGTGAIWGLVIAQEHVQMQTAKFSFLFSCEFEPNFPSWAPLHEWLPSLFAATGDCGEISWQFFGFSMPQWMVFIFLIYTALFGVVLLSRLASTKSI